MTFAETLYSYLITYPGLVALVAARVYPTKLPQEPTLPAVTYQRVSDVPEYSHDPGGSHALRVQVTCWAATYAAAEAVAVEVVSAADGWHAAMGGAAFVENMIDLSNPETGVYQVGIDVMFEGITL